MSVVLLLVALALVGNPYWQAWRGKLKDDDWVSSGTAAAEGRTGARSMEKDMVMSTLSEIEFDYHMKKLSAEDYRNLKNDYAHAAVALLEAENQNDKVREQIEREIEEDLSVLASNKH